MSTQEDAATKIQALARGRLARRQSDALREEMARAAAAAARDEPAAGRISRTASVRSTASTHTSRKVERLTKKTRPTQDPQQLENQLISIQSRVKNLPRRTESEQRLWEAVEKLVDLGSMQRAHIQQLQKTQGRFAHKYDSKETKAIEQSFLALKKKETEALEQRKLEFERLIEVNAETMNNVRTELQQVQRANRELEQNLRDTDMQRKHAKENFEEASEWLDEARRQVQTLQKQVDGVEEARRALGDEKMDMQTKIENFQRDIAVRDDMIRDETKRASRAKDLADEAARGLTEERNKAENLNRQLVTNGAEAEAEYSRLREEIAQLEVEIETLLERTARWENFDKLCPDYEGLVFQLEAKDEVLHRAKQTVAMKHNDEVTLLSKIAAADNAVQERVAKLAEIQNELETMVPPMAEELEAVRAVCVEKTHVACYPDPCPIGKELHLVVTTCDSTGLPIRGVDRSEFKIQQLTFPPAGGCQLGEEFAMRDVLFRDRPSSTFECSYRPGFEGRSGYKVSFRGQTFIASAHVPTPAPSSYTDDKDEDRLPRFTVSCTPNVIAVGETLDVSIVLREPGSLLPTRNCTYRPEHFRVAPYTTAQGVKDFVLQHIEGTPVYRTAVAVDGVTAQGTPRDYIGLEVMLQGGTEASRGSSKLIADSRNDREFDPTSTTVFCTPDPAHIGEPVTVCVVARNSYGVPIPSTAEHHAPTPILAPMGSATKVEQPVRVEGASQVFVGTMVPAEPGRCGVTVTMGGHEVGATTVTVRRPEPVDPTQTVLKVEPNVVPAGETLHITLTTCDKTGRATPGPEPTAFRVTPVGQHSVLLPLRRVSDSESTYVTTLRTSTASQHTTSGVTVDFDGVTLAKKVRVSAEPLDIPAEVQPKEAAKPVVPKYSICFAHDPLAPGSVVPVTISVNHDDPAQDRRRSNLRSPKVQATVNCELVKDAQPVPGARYVWRALVRTGTVFGHCSVEAEVDGRTYTASTTVSGNTVESLDKQITRLGDLHAAVRDRMQHIDEERRTLDERARELERREADLAEREAALDERTAVDQHDELPQHVLFGLHLSDGIQYGYQWESIDGAKVVDIVAGGPIDQKDVRIEKGDVLRQVVYKEHNIEHKCTIHQMDDFRRVARGLSHLDPVPEVTLSFYKPSTDTLLDLQVRPQNSQSPPGRSVGTVRHDRKTIDTSFSAISPGRSSVRSRN